MKHLKLVIISLSLLLLSVCVFSGVSSAQSIKAEESVVVTESETIDGSLFATGKNINIAGIVNGDVYCAGQAISISGTVKGDVFCTGQNVNIGGKVGGGVRVAGQNVTLSGTVQGSATVGSQTLTVEKGSVIVRDLVGGAQSITLNGLIGRDMTTSSNLLTINGNIGRDLQGEIEMLVVGSTGSVNGNVKYNSNNSPVIGQGGVIRGEVTRTPVVKKSDMPSYEQFISGAIFILLTLLITSFVIALLFPNLLKEASSKTKGKSGHVALVGFALVVLIPLVIFLLLISAIGTPLGILLSLVWLIVILLSCPFAAYHIGRLILKTAKNPVRSMLLGVTIVLASCIVPFLGCFVIFATHLFGVGMLAPVLVDRLRHVGLKT